MPTRTCLVAKTLRLPENSPRSVKPLNLAAAGVTAALKKVPRWRLRRGAITRTYEFTDFVEAIRFVNQAARLAEAAWHHPDIEIRWNRVILVLTTHDAGGLTRKDFSLARKFDALAGSRRGTKN